MASVSVKVSGLSKTALSYLVWSDTAVLVLFIANDIVVLTDDREVLKELSEDIVCFT